MLRDPAARPEAEQVTAQGLTDAVGHAREDEDAHAAGTAGRPAADGAGGPQQAQALADGTLDTATGACLDFTNSPSGPPGSRAPPRSWTAWRAPTRSPPAGTCPASPGCTAPWTSCAPPRPGDVARDWRAHFLRLTTLLEDNTTAAERQAAARAASDADRELIGRCSRAGTGRDRHRARRPGTR